MVLVPPKTVALISGEEADGPFPGGHTLERMGQAMGRRERTSAEVGTKSRFFFTSQPLLSPPEKRFGNPQLAHEMGCVGNCDWHARAAFLKLVQFGKSFFLVVWASAIGICFRVLLNTCLCWCSPSELQMLRARKGPKIPDL